MLQDVRKSEHKGLVHHIARKFKTQKQSRIPLHYFEEWGYEALSKAYTVFDEDRGSKFSTFCYTTISNHIKNRFRFWHKRLEQEYGLRPALEGISKGFEKGVFYTDIEVEKCTKEESLDYLDFLIDNTDLSEIDSYILSSLREGETLEFMADHLGITHQAVFQRKKRLYRRLRATHEQEMKL